MGCHPASPTSFSSNQRVFRVARFFRVATLLLTSIVSVASPLSAQGVYKGPQLPDPEDEGRIRLGPVRLTPSIAVTNLGVDSNVFNEFEDPKRDYVAQVGPKAEFWARLGPRLRVYGSTGVDYHYFHRYESQRSFGTGNIVRLDADVGRLIPFAEGSYTRTRVRPGFEIDARALRTERSGRAGLALRAGSRTTVSVWAGESRFRYGSDEEFLNINLGETLNRNSRRAGGGLEVQLTPLTTFIVDGEAGTDRFPLSPQRNAETFRILPGFRFKPFALIDGSLFVGYRRFQTIDPLLPDFSGTVAQIDLGYSLRATRFTGTYNRDVTYSFEILEPYYVQTDWSLGVTQKITYGWDVRASGGRYRLDYQAVSASQTGRRQDRGVLYSVGVGYIVGQHTRIGLDFGHIGRTSEAAITRNYNGYQAGLSVTYGVKQR